MQLVRRYSEVLQRAELRRHVLALAYGYAAALTFAAAGVGDMRNADSTPLTSPLLAPLNVLLQWLATQPDYVRCDGMPLLRFSLTPRSFCAQQPGRVSARPLTCSPRLFWISARGLLLDSG